MENKIFDENPSLKSYHETSDGEAFYNHQDARNHARSLTDKNVKEVVNPKLSGDATTTDETAKDAQITSAPQYPLNAVNTAKAAAACTTLEDLEQYRTDDRKTVVAAYEKRKTELTSPVTEKPETGAGTELTPGNEQGEGENQKQEGADPANSTQNPE